MKAANERRLGELSSRLEALNRRKGDFEDIASNREHVASLVGFFRPRTPCSFARQHSFDAPRTRTVSCSAVVWTGLLRHQPLVQSDPLASQWAACIRSMHHQRKRPVCC